MENFFKWIRFRNSPFVVMSIVMFSSRVLCSAHMISSLKDRATLLGHVFLTARLKPFSIASVTKGADENTSVPQIVLMFSILSFSPKYFISFFFYKWITVGLASLNSSSSSRIRKPYISFSRNTSLTIMTVLKQSVYLSHSQFQQTVFFLLNTLIHSVSLSMDRGI